MPKSDQDVAAGAAGRSASLEGFAARQADLLPRKGCGVSHAASPSEVGRRRGRESPSPAETRAEPRRQSPEARQLKEDIPSSAVRAWEVGREGKGTRGLLPVGLEDSTGYRKPMEERWQRTGRDLTGLLFSGDGRAA